MAQCDKVNCQPASSSGGEKNQFGGRASAAELANPRVGNEHHNVNQEVGTTITFEMYPLDLTQLHTQWSAESSCHHRHWEAGSPQ